MLNWNKKSHPSSKQNINRKMYQSTFASSFNQTSRVGSPILNFLNFYLMTGSVALMDFITYLVTTIILIKSNIGDPTLEIGFKA